MTIQDLGAIGEFMSSIVITVTLVFLAFEVRATKRATLLANQHERQRARNSIFDSIATNSELAGIIHKANAYVAPGATPAENAAKEDVVVLASGLQYTELSPGTGARPKPGATVMVHYRGTSIDGEVFDSSIDRGEPAKFSTDGVIPGFREALTNMVLAKTVPR